MLLEHLETFKPSDDVPLVISFVEMLREKGLTTEIAWDHWDFEVYNHEDDPLMVIKTVKNRISQDTMTRLLVEKAPYKVILVDGDRPDYDQLVAQRVFLASSGAGVYVRGAGWVAKPSGKVPVEVDDLRLRLAKRWKRDELGVWRKACTSCGELKGTDGFYKSASRTARDPYRNQCKDCMAFNAKIRYALKKQEQNGRKAA